MAGRFTVIPESTFNELQMDAGILLSSFNPASPEVLDANIICATTGGINASCTPEYSDFGEDVDNCPNNMMEFKHLDSWTCTISTTCLGTSPRAIRMALGAADIDGNDETKIVPRAKLELTDFGDIWWVGDRADGGLVAIQLKNALATSGFSIQTTKNGKGQVTLELTGHVSINAQNVVPMVFYSAEGDGLQTISLTSFESTTVGETTITANYTPASGEAFVYKLGSAPVAVEYEDVLTTGWTSWDGSDDIAATTGQYITVAAVVSSTNKAVAAGSVMVTAKAASPQE